MRIQGKVLSDENLIYQKRIYQTRYTVHYHMRKIVQNQIWQTLGRSPVNVLSRTDTLLKALSSQAIKTSKDGDCTTSLDNPSNTWLFHAGKVFSWFQPETFLHQFTIIVSDSIFSKNLPACSSRQLSGPCEMTSPPCWMSPIPLAPAHRAGAPAPIILVALHWTHSRLPMSSSCSGTEDTTGCGIADADESLHGSFGHVSNNRCIYNPTFLFHILLTCCIHSQHSFLAFNLLPTHCFA